MLNCTKIYCLYFVVTTLVLGACKNEEPPSPVLLKGSQIIADHTVVDKFVDIPLYYIDEVKKMMVWFPGESHSGAYRSGMELLEALNPAYECNISTREAYTDEYVRVNSSGWIGEATWFTWYAFSVETKPAASTTIKRLLTEYNSQGYPLHVIGFAWCSDIVTGEGHESVDADPVYECHWYGESNGGPDGDKGWGLDAEDYAITGNRVDLTTYFSATEEYISYCNTNNYPTKIVFTTGPVDLDGSWIGEGAYQGHIKHEAIRDYVKSDTTRILFDYADILSYDDNGSLTTQSWNGHIFPSITTTNALPKVSAYHISEAGAIRLAKAQWWLLARVAGWDGTAAK